MLGGSTWPVAQSHGVQHLDALSQSQSQLEFSERISRIAKHANSGKQLLFVGVDEVYAMPRRDRKAKRSTIGTMVGNILSPFVMIAALSLGALSQAIGQVARFHVLGLLDLNANPDVDMAVQFILGMGISMLLGYVLLLNSRGLTVVKALGVCIGVLGYHNAVHLWPQEFAKVTSDLWVNQILSHTQMYSIVWRGIGYTL